MAAKTYPVEIGIRVSEKQAKLLKLEAEEQQRSVAGVVRFALERQYFDARKRGAKTRARNKLSQQQEPNDSEE